MVAWGVIMGVPDGDGVLCGDRLVGAISVGLELGAALVVLTRIGDSAGGGYGVEPDTPTCCGKGVSSNG